MHPHRLRTMARHGRAFLVLPAAMALAGCASYGVGIPLVPGLSLGLGATSEGGYSIGLNTGFGPIGGGVAMHRGGLITGSTGVGVGAGPVGVGVGQSAVLYDPASADRPEPSVLSARPRPPIYDRPGEQDAP